jgi:hypothetical protein
LHAAEDYWEVIALVTEHKTNTVDIVEVPTVVQDVVLPVTVGDRRILLPENFP